MQFTLWDGTVIETATHPIRSLIGLVKYLAKRTSSHRTWTTDNGPDAVPRFVRAVRARMFRERRPIYGRLRAMLNQMDPPACRCGKSGTRMIGGETFCLACGPSAGARRRKALIEVIYETGEYAEIKRQGDARLLQRQSLARTVKGGRR